MEEEKLFSKVTGNRSGTINENMKNRTRASAPKEVVFSKTLTLSNETREWTITAEEMMKFANYYLDERRPEKFTVRIKNEGNQVVVLENILYGEKALFNDGLRSRMHMHEDEDAVQGHHSIEASKEETFNYKIEFSAEEKNAIRNQKDDPWATSCAATPIGETTDENGTRIVYIPMARFCNKTPNEEETFVKLAIDAFRNGVQPKQIRLQKTHVYGIERTLWEKTYDHIVLFEEMQNRPISVVFAKGAGKVLIEVTLEYQQEVSFRKASVLPQELEESTKLASEIKDVYPFIPPIFEKNGKLLVPSLGNKLPRNIAGKELVLTELKDDAERLVSLLTKMVEDSKEKPVVVFLSKAIRYFTDASLEHDPNQHDIPVIQRHIEERHLKKALQTNGDQTSIDRQMKTIETVLFSLLKNELCMEKGLQELEEYNLNTSPIDFLNHFINSCKDRHATIHGKRNSRA